MKGQITVREVDQDIFRNFKAEAARRGLTVGKAITLAMEKFKSELESKRKLELWKPTSWGKGTMYVSENMDDVLYGEK